MIDRATVRISQAKNGFQNGLMCDHDESWHRACVHNGTFSRLASMRFSSSNRFRILSLAIGLGLAAACGGYHTGEAGGNLAPARLFFTNESLDEAAVYAVSGTQQIRIGTVMGGRTDTLVVPPTMFSSGTLHFYARALAHARVAQSGPVPLLPGDDLVVRLPLDQNTLIVLPPRT